MEAFCSTYHAMRGRLHAQKEVDDVGPRDDLHGARYHDAFAECVSHFQHFAELVIKDFLRAEHPLLADDTSGHHVLFHKLLKGEPPRRTKTERSSRSSSRRRRNDSTRSSRQIESTSGFTSSPITSAR